MTNGFGKSVSRTLSYERSIDRRFDQNNDEHIKKVIVDPNFLYAPINPDFNVKKPILSVDTSLKSSLFRLDMMRKAAKIAGRDETLFLIAKYDESYAKFSNTRDIFKGSVTLRKCPKDNYMLFGGEITPGLVETLSTLIDLKHEPSIDAKVIDFNEAYQVPYK